MIEPAVLRLGWRSISVLLLVGAACSRTAETVRADPQSKPVLIDAFTPPPPTIRCALTAARAHVRAVVYHGSGSYGRSEVWTLGLAASGWTLEQGGAPRTLSPSQAIQLITKVAVVLESPAEPGSYKTVSASLEWSCDSGVPRKVVVHSMEDDATGRVALVEDAFSTVGK